jgi:hypothetical protein
MSASSTGLKVAVGVNLAIHVADSIQGVFDCGRRVSVLVHKCGPDDMNIRATGINA